MNPTGGGKTAIFRRFENLVTEPFGTAPVRGAYWHTYFLSPWQKYLESYKEATDWIRGCRTPQSASETMLGFREMTRTEKDEAYRKLLALKNG